MGFASRTTLIASAVVALGLAGAPQAVATTAVSGAGDASSPLLIDPRTSPSDALQLRLNVGSPAPVAFIERMPVTKTIEDVSLGDFQADPGDCANPMQLYLMVREHPAGDADQAIQVAYAPAQPTVPDSAGVMTWRLDQPVTLQAGRGYSFAIMSTDPASCHFLYQTTWDHNGAQVEGGTNQCASGVRFGENDSVLLKRGWHTQGVSDGVYGPDGCAGSKWDPGLSEGWLVSIPSGDAWDVATAAIAQGLPVPPPPPDSCTINDNHLDPGYGAEQLQYYPVNYPPGPVSYDYYLCRWTQFAAPGHQLPDGWYYGLPWRTERRGAPRDVYVKLASATAAYVALGDSFQSGLGAGDYESGTTGESSTCYRSNNAYPHQLVNDGAVTGGLDFAACKGAKINDLYTGLNGEGPQLDHLSDRTRLATVGIGGNDLGFADTLLACIKRLVSTASCEQDFDADVMNRLLALQNHGSMDPRNQFQRLYSDIRFRAPDAGILAVDYPRFFPLDGGWDWTTIPAVIADPLTSLDAIKRCAGIRLSDQMWINEKIHMLDEVVEASALSMGVEPVRMYGAFAGHELCADGDSWLHGIQAPFIGNVSESFHPNAPGQTAFAKAIEDVLAGRSGASPGTQYALLPGGTQTQTLDVASGTPGLTASTSWPGSDVVTSLVSPSGRVINRDTSAADVFHRVAPTRELYYVRDPEPGTWTIKVYGANVRPGGELVTLTTYKEPKPNDAATPLLSTT